MKFLDIFKKKENDCCNIKVINLDEQQENKTSTNEYKNNDHKNDQDNSYIMKD